MGKQTWQSRFGTESQSESEGKTASSTVTKASLMNNIIINLSSYYSFTL